MSKNSNVTQELYFYSKPNPPPPLFSSEDQLLQLKSDLLDKEAALNSVKEKVGVGVEVKGYHQVFFFFRVAEVEEHAAGRGEADGTTRVADADSSAGAVSLRVHSHQ